jgi:hypothetical protein
MGFFSKIFKGVGKVFKKIGKGIKSAFKKFGKFMGKIGIVGQLAMMFVLPGIGNALLGTAGTAATVAGVGGATVTAAAIPASGLLGGALGSVGVAAGKAAVWVGNKIATVKNVFSNITQGITETLGNFAKTAGKKLGFKGDMFTNAADNFFSSGTTGDATALSKSFGSTSKFQNLTTDFSKISKMVDDDIAKGGSFRSTEQTLAEKIQATDFDAPKLADGSIDPFAIDPEMSIDPSISKAMGTTDLTKSPSLLAEKSTTVPVSTTSMGTIEKFVRDKGEDLVDQGISGFAAQMTGTGPQAAQITNYSSAPAQFTEVGTGADSMLMNTGAIQQDMQAGLQGMFGHPALVYNAEQETANFRRTEAQQIAYRGGI